MKTIQCIVIISAGLALACKTAPRVATDAKPVQVRIEPVQSELIGLPVFSSGIVTLSRETRLSFKTGGIIAFISVEEGDRVRKGDILAALNMAEIEAQVKQARNGYEKAARDFSRVTDLFADSVVTLEQKQNAETALNVARSNLDMVEFNRDHSSIVAPDNGTILKRFAESSEMIAPGYPVFLFGTEGRFWKVKTGLADRDFVKVRSGDSALVTMDAYPEEKFSGRVDQISESANPMTGTYDVELELEPAKHRLASGFVANVEIYPSVKQSFRIVPLSSIFRAEGHTGTLYMVDDSMIARKLEVNIAAVFGSEAAIAHGLENVNAVVTDGAAYLSEGDHVNIVK